MEENLITINNDVYASLLSSVLKEDISKTAQSYIIAGVAGSGKTFLLQRLADAIQSHPSLTPIYMDGKALFSTEDIWRRCANLLWIDIAEKTFEEVMSWQIAHECRVILLIDNIQYYFKRTGPIEHHTFRENLNREGSPILIGASNKVLPEFTNYDAAFFDGFKLLYLRPLTPAEIETLAGPPADPERLKHLLSYLSPTARSVLMAKTILEHSDSTETDIKILLKNFSAYYQYKYDECPVQAQRILMALSRMQGGAKLQDIRSMTGQDNGHLSPYLTQMVEGNVLDKRATTSRNGVYSIADPLFKLWLQNEMKSEKSGKSPKDDGLLGAEGKVIRN